LRSISSSCSFWAIRCGKQTVSDKQGLETLNLQAFPTLSLTKLPGAKKKNFKENTKENTTLKITSDYSDLF